MATLALYLLTFNCARNLVDPSSLAPHLFKALPNQKQLPDVIALSLQEVAPIAYAFLGGVLLNPYLEHIIETVDIAAKARSNGQTRYKLVIARHVGLTALLVFAKPDLAESVRWIQTAGVGVGLWEMGNKGAVGARICFDLDGQESELTFTAAHLAPFEECVLRRNQDWENIVRGLAFTPSKVLPSGQVGESDETQPLLSGDDQDVPPLSGLFKPHNHIFFAGDLNYRTHSQGPKPTDYLSFPQPGQSHSTRHFSKWLVRDQLTQERDADRTLNGFEEAPITFPPTYKYSHASAGRPSKKPLALEISDTTEPGTWNWSRHRFPSWCDRILFTSTGVDTHIYTALPVQPTSDHRPVALSVTVPRTVAVEAIEAPFPLNPQWKKRRAAARRREILVGVMAYLTLTREGNAMVVGLVAGIMGGYFLIKALV